MKTIMHGCQDLYQVTNLLGWASVYLMQSITAGFVLSHILSHVLYNTLGINNELGVYWDQVISFSLANLWGLLVH